MGNSALAPVTWPWHLPQGALRLPVNQIQPLPPPPFLGVMAHILANSLHRIPPSLTPSLPHKDDIFIRAHWSTLLPRLSMHVAC